MVGSRRSIWRMTRSCTASKMSRFKVAPRPRSSNGPEPRFWQLVHLTAVRPGRDAHFVARLVAQDPPPRAIVDDDAAARSDCGLHPFARLVARDRHVDVHSVVERLGRIEVLHPNR